MLPVIRWVLSELYPVEDNRLRQLGGLAATNAE